MDSFPNGSKRLQNCLYHLHCLVSPNSFCKSFHSTSAEKIFIRVIDPFTIKPLDKKTILDNARATKGRIITVEDHYHEGELSLGAHSPHGGFPGVGI